MPQTDFEKILLPAVEDGFSSLGDSSKQTIFFHFDRSAICKRVIDAHGGSISVESEIEKGTTFTVTLPIKPKTEEGGEEVWIKPLESSLLTTTKT